MTNHQHKKPLIDTSKAATHGEPSYLWRDGQERRLSMIRSAAGETLHGWVLENGCGVGEYLQRLEEFTDHAIGLEVDFERALAAKSKASRVICASGEQLPFAQNTFNLVLSHEVLEHVQDDRLALKEIFRVLSGRGRLVLFVPNRGYPFETHGIYWNNKYHFGNKLFVNYLPRSWRDKLAPHVRSYSQRDLEKLFSSLRVKVLERTIIFGAYDNIIARAPWLGKIIRAVLHFLERTPLRVFGLSHFWVVEKRLTLREYLQDED
jgi:SAM-dependent methyltransferase